MEKFKNLFDGKLIFSLIAALLIAGGIYFGVNYISGLDNKIDNLVIQINQNTQNLNNVVNYINQAVQKPEELKKVK
ncbi:MAG: hypothetical protein QMD65_02080 [Patescibacteria group bacterium]|nr:hypothetical protein [Patescibacteria group bacterium]